MSLSSSALTIVVTAPLEDAELACDALFQLGAVAVEERPLGDAVELRAALGEDRPQLLRILEHLRWSWRFEDVDLAVTDTWRQFVTPTYVDDRIVVIPAWMPAPPSEHDIRVVIEPGPTFGMGNHATTVLSLRALRRAVRPGDRVLDVGTGSGVLAIAAVLLGAERAHGTDLNPACMEVVTANAAANGVEDRVSVSLESLDAFTEPVDVVVANILAPALRELAPELVRLTGRTLIISGILDGRYADVVEALAPLTVRHRLKQDGWVALSLER